MIRELLRRLLGSRGSAEQRAAASPPDPDAGQRIDDARQRLKETIPPPEETNEGPSEPPPQHPSP